MMGRGVRGLAWVSWKAKSADEKAMRTVSSEKVSVRTEGRIDAPVFVDVI